MILSSIILSNLCAPTCQNRHIPSFDPARVVTNDRHHVPPESPLHQPHGKLVKSTFSDPDNARAFLQAHLPRKLARRIDWNSLALVSGSFIDHGIQRN